MVTIEDLQRDITRARKANEQLENANRINQERLILLAQQFAEIGELLSLAGEKAKDARKLVQ